MRTDRYKQTPQDARKLALSNSARLRRTARLKLEKQTGQAVTEEMVSSALTQRNIRQLDEITRLPNPSHHNFSQRHEGAKRPQVSTLRQFPYKALKKHVAWLTTAEQNAPQHLTLSHELDRFHSYVKLDNHELNARQSMLLDIQDAVQSKYPLATLSQFGSYPLGLSIFMSDIDISVDNALLGDVHATSTDFLVHRHETTNVAGSSSASKRSISAIGASAPNKRIRFDDNNTLDTPELGGVESVSWSLDKGNASDINSLNTAAVSNPSSLTIDQKKGIAGGGSSSNGGVNGSSSGNGRRVAIDDQFDDDFSDESSGEDESYRDTDVQYDDDGDDGGCDDYEDYSGKREKQENGGSGAGSVASISASNSTSKLPLDIDVPIWDGVSDGASNAVGSGSDGFLDEDAAERLMYSDYSMGSAKVRRMSADMAKKEKLDVLNKIFRTIKSMAWVRRVEFRRHARVPIINLVHRNGVECDISLDMSQQDTSLVVRKLLERCGESLRVLSSFLKVYLSQLGLDAPFTGGLGSYKLYVLIAKHIERNPDLIADKNNPQYGPLLLSFLQYYGDKQNLNKSTIVRVDGAVEPTSFAATMRIDDIRFALEQARLVLIRHKPSLADVGRPAGPVLVPRAQSGHSFLNSQISGSYLATVLNTAHLFGERAQSRQVCLKFPKRSAEEREAVARGVLQQMNQRLHSESVSGVPLAATLEEVREQNPALAARLRSFASVDSAVGHLAGMTDTKRSRDIQLEFTHDLGITNTVAASPQLLDAPISVPIVAPARAPSAASAPVDTEVTFAPTQVVISKLAVTTVPSITSDNIANSPAVTAPVAAPVTVTDPVSALVTAPITARKVSTEVAAILARLESALPILMIQRTFPPLFFNRSSPEGIAIREGQMDLPPHMLFKNPFDHRNLPASIRDVLGTFPSLEYARLFKNKSSAELKAMHTAERNAKKELINLCKFKVINPFNSPEEEDFIRRCAVGGIFVPYKKPLTSIEKEIHSISTRGGRNSMEYVDQHAEHDEDVDLRALVLLRQHDEQLRAGIVTPMAAIEPQTSSSYSVGAIPVMPVFDEKSAVVQEIAPEIQANTEALAPGSYEALHKKHGHRSVKSLLAEQSQKDELRATYDAAYNAGQLGAFGETKQEQDRRIWQLQKQGLLNAPLPAHSPLTMVTKYEAVKHMEDCMRVYLAQRAQEEMQKTVAKQQAMKDTKLHYKNLRKEKALAKAAAAVPLSSTAPAATTTTTATTAANTVISTKGCVVVKSVDNKAPILDSSKKRSLSTDLVAQDHDRKKSKPFTVVKVEVDGRNGTPGRASPMSSSSAPVAVLEQQAPVSQTTATSAVISPSPSHTVQQPLQAVHATATAPATGTATAAVSAPSHTSGTTVATASIITSELRTLHTQQPQQSSSYYESVEDEEGRLETPSLSKPTFGRRSLGSANKPQ